MTRVKEIVMDLLSINYFARRDVWIFILSGTHLMSVKKMSNLTISLKNQVPK